MLEAEYSVSKERTVRFFQGLSPKTVFEVANRLGLRDAIKAEACGTQTGALGEWYAKHPAFSDPEIAALVAVGEKEALSIEDRASAGIGCHYPCTSRLISQREGA